MGTGALERVLTSTTKDGALSKQSRHPISFRVVSEKKQLIKGSKEKNQNIARLSFG